MAISADGKPAFSNFTVIEAFTDFSLIEVRPETGRTHQIRVHMAKIGHPLINDRLYGYNGPEFEIQGPALHAASISFRHPFIGRQVEYTAPIPPDMQSIISTLRSES